MHGETSDIVWMSFESGDFFVRVVIEDAKLKVVGAGDEPVLARDKFAAANGDFRNLESFDDCACFVVIYVHSAVVETCQKPWLGGMKVDSLDPVGPVEQLPLGGGSARAELKGEQRNTDINLE